MATCLARLREDYDRRPPVVSDALRSRALERQRAALRLQTRAVEVVPERPERVEEPLETSGAL